MDDPWKLLQSKAVEVSEVLWYDFAKEGRESAVFAPLGQYPNAAAWLARNMALSTDSITRKLGAMLAGWICDPQHVELLSEMLDRERQVFREDSLSANSVGESIMFAATRWTESAIAQMRDAGIHILASMIRDALTGTPWNTANWAVANLYQATEGKHEVFQSLAVATEAEMQGQQFLQNLVTALRQNDKQRLTRAVAAPSEPLSLSTNDPHYALVSSLWSAAASAEAAAVRD